MYSECVPRPANIEAVQAVTLQKIGLAFKYLHVGGVRSLANQDFTVGVFTPNEVFFHRVVSCLMTGNVSGMETRSAGRHILRLSSEQDFDLCDFGFVEPGLPHPHHFYGFDPYNPTEAVERVLDDYEDLWLPAARRFPIFRDLVTERIIWKISRENAIFSLATALPNVAPSLVSLPWAVGELLSDTAFLTMNQVRMAFLIAAASDCNVGYLEQRMQICSIVAAAFGWRAVARELVSKMPAGGGLMPKGLISFAGTYAIGKGLDCLCSTGQRLSCEEKKRLYLDAYERGRDIVGSMVRRLSGHLAATGNA